MDLLTREKLAQNLICLRHAFGYTQTELAKVLHMSRPTYALYENSLRIPNIDTIYDLSALYKVDIDTLINSDTDQLFSHIAQHNDYPCEKKKLMDVFKRLSTFSRGCLIERAETLLFMDEIMRRGRQ